MDYLIHFQNVGNDTAFNITIRDTLSSLLDMNSFHVISSSSPADIQWNAVSRELRFVFNHILLPDSTTDSAGSNGYIHYRIQPVSNLVVGTQIDNTAAIYFDFNQPVITNTATTALLLDDRIPAVKEGRLSIFPSPAHSYIRFDIPADFQSSDLNLYVKDIHGRNLIGQKIGSGRTDGRVEIENLPSGIYLLELRSGERSIKSKFIKN
ncbi:MAG: T9SS type A sorting domain-containing protein [Bacteroidia bacterium]